MPKENYVGPMIRFNITRWRRLLPSIAMTLSACGLNACTGSAVLNALTPKGGYSVERDVAYGQDPRQRLDLYVPDGAAADAPLLVFFYGGNWESGSKELYGFVGQAFASRGYVTAIPDYRLYPQVRYPAFLDDAAAAVAWIHAQQPGRSLYLAGHSAGAYLAMMLNLDQQWLRSQGQEPCALVVATVGLAGPYDFLPLRDATLEQIFGPGPASPDSQPINHVTAGAAPTLLVTGSADQTVGPYNSRRLAERLESTGVPVELRVYDGIGHVGIVAALGAPLRFVAPTLDDADAFMRRAATMPARTCAPAPADRSTS